MRSLILRSLRGSRSKHTSRKVHTQIKTSNSTTPQHAKPDLPATGIAQDAQKQQGRLDRLLKRTPKFLHRHVVALRSAPITHVTAFLILHEITAVVPLLGLAGAFHYYHWLPAYFSEGAWVLAGVEKFGRYFKRKGWISGDDELEAERLAEQNSAASVEKRQSPSAKWWGRGEGSVRIVVEFATAYAIVKALLIPRLMISAWGAPWFARWTVIPLVTRFKKLFGNKTTASKGT